MGGLLVARAGVAEEELSLTQCAFLFSLSRRGSPFSAVGIRREACVLSAAVSELVLAGVFLPQPETRFAFSGKEPPEYLAPLCTELRPGESQEWEPFLDSLLFSVCRSPVLTALNVSLGESLCRLGFVGRESQRSQVLFPPCRLALDSAAGALRTQLGGRTELSRENGILCYLLNATGLWNRLFSRSDLVLARRQVPNLDGMIPGRVLRMIDRLDCALPGETFCAC